MKKHWWKILAVLLLLYVFVVGLFIPLGPGIQEVTPDKTASGTQITLTAQGYNTRFSQGSSSLQVWLAIWNETDTHNICGKANVLSDHKLTADFDLPKVEEPVYANFFVSSDIDGTFGLQNALFLRADTSIADTMTATGSCTVAPLAKKADFTHYPYRELLYETIRNLFYHVPLWFAMMIVLSIGLIYSLKFLRTNKIEDDITAAEMINSGVLLGILGIATGSMWARHTWGAWWVNDPQLNGAAIALLIYLAYIILRGSMDEEQKRGRIAAVYSIFAYVMFVVFIMIYPKMHDSLHPANKDNPSFRSYDMDNTMRTVFYPAVIGFTLLAIWLASIKIRLKKIYRKVLFNV